MLQEVEKFVRSRVWEAPAESTTSDVVRFCRGRTLNEKIPPTWLIAEVGPMSLHKLDDDLLWKLSRKAVIFLVRLITAACGVELGGKDAELGVIYHTASNVATWFPPQDRCSSCVTFVS